MSSHITARDPKEHCKVRPVLDCFPENGLNIEPRLTVNPTMTGGYYLDFEFAVRPFSHPSKSIPNASSSFFRCFSCFS